ncbi:MAG: hypothetical protein HFACDABA_00868 [Anaerolineales bacterium]|nr:hypothetical protein [Anaerolineales bacterium]
MSHRGQPIAVICILIAALSACALPGALPSTTETPATASPAATVEGGGAVTPTDIPTPQPDLGEMGNPILLALPPSQVADGETIANGQQLAALLTEQSGLHVVAVAPSSYTALIEALRIGNAHVAGLPPYPLVKAYAQGAVTAAFASTQEDAAAYGAQFLARSDRFESFFDENAGRNFKEPPEALMQFSGKKPCWTTTDSLSGYRLPAGALGAYQIPVQEGAFLQSHFSVVRALLLESVCDFGATYIDARTFPVLSDEFPRIMEEVIVVWQIPALIPYNGLFLSSALPADVQAQLRNALAQVALSDEGRQLIQSLYKVENMVPVEDVFYAEFVRYITASGADWDSLVR